MAPISDARDLSLTSGLGATAYDYYKYAPLPTPTAIRVIEWPHTLVHTSDLRCKLRIIDLADPNRPPYTSVSYTWGAADGVDAEDADAMESLFTNMIVCEDLLLRVTENAHTALSQLRWRGRAHLFWLDAVSINQQDVEERSQQVALMGRIYAEAERTVVWLGECDETTEKFYREHTEYLLKKDSYRPGRREHLSEVRDDLRKGVGIAEFLALIPHPTLSVDIDGVSAFFARSWFQRLWVIQEVVLAKNLWIFCGDFTFYWTGISSLTSAYKERVDVVGQSDAAQRAAQGLSTVQLVSFLREDHAEFGGLTSLTSSHQTDVEEYCATLVTLIQAFAPSLATDVRDRIYGPLALTSQICKSSPELQFKPDYELAIDTTFYDFAIFILGQMPTLSYLSLCKTANSNQPRILPSWVPDFRARSQQKPISWLTKCNATAGWDKRSKLANHVVDGHCLKVFGKGFSKIKEILDITTSLTDVNVVTLLKFTSPPPSQTRFRFRLDRRPSSLAASLASSPYRDLWHTMTADPFTTRTNAILRAKGNPLELFSPSEGAFSDWLCLKLMSDFYQGTFSVRQMIYLISKASEGFNAKAKNNASEAKAKANKTIASVLLDLRLFQTYDGSPQSAHSFRFLTRLNAALHTVWAHIPWDKVCSLSAEDDGAKSSLPPMLYPGTASKYDDAGEREFFNAHRWATIFRDTLLRFTVDRTLFRTQDGYIGLTPRCSRPGDQIWFVRSCKAPFVLRPLEEKGEFELIGEVYLMGFMDGLICELHQETDLEEIKLR